MVARGLGVGQWVLSFNLLLYVSCSWSEWEHCLVICGEWSNATCPLYASRDLSLGYGLILMG